MTKKNPDGSKRRHSKPRAAGDRQAPRSAPRPVAPGYVRKDSGHLTGSTESIGEFFIKAFAKLGDLALQEIDEQKSGEVERRPFHCHGNSEVSFGASYLLEIKGFGSADPEFRAALEDIEATGGVLNLSTLDALPLTFGERIGLLASRAEEEIMRQLDAELLFPFTVGCFVQVTDFELLIEFRIEQREPRAFPGHAANRPDLS